MPLPNGGLTQSKTKTASPRWLLGPVEPPEMLVMFDGWYTITGMVRTSGVRSKESRERESAKYPPNRTMRDDQDQETLYHYPRGRRNIHSISRIHNCEDTCSCYIPLMNKSSGLTPEDDWVQRGVIRAIFRDPVTVIDCHRDPGTSVARWL